MLAKRGDSDDLARALLTLIDRPDERQRIGVALRARAHEHYSWRDAGEQIVRLYRELL